MKITGEKCNVIFILDMTTSPFSSAQDKDI